MNYIVYDLELNSKPFKSHIPNEIIEIGAVKLNDNLQKLDSFSSFVKPRRFNKLFPIVKRKTKISQDDIDNAPGFKAVINNFIRWVGDDYVLISWGHDDIHHLFSNCKYHKVRIGWLKKNVDIQKQFSAIFNMPSNQRYSLENALCAMELKMGENLHRALNDAEYTAQIFTAIFNKIDLTVFNSVKTKRKHKNQKNSQT